MNIERKKNILWQLFKSTFLLSSFAFGGGFVVVSLFKKKFVEELHWLEEEEMLDITAIAQSSPGPILINAAVILGYRVAGIPGSLTAVLGTALPPLIIISVIYHFYAQFRTNRIIAIALQVMRAGVAAVIFDVVLNLGKNVIKMRRKLYILLMAAAFIAAVVFNVSAILIILICLFIGITDLLTGIKKTKKGENTSCH